MSEIHDDMFEHFEGKPAATVHGTGSGEATFCKNCGKPIVEDTSGRGWRHGETGPYVCSETYAQPGGTPPVSPTVTLEDVIAKYREACDEVIRNAKPYIESASDWPETQHRMQAITAPLCAAERFHDDALALLRAAERQK